MSNRQSRYGGRAGERPGGRPGRTALDPVVVPLFGDPGRCGLVAAEFLSPDAHRAVVVHVTGEAAGACPDPPSEAGLSLERATDHLRRTGVPVETYVRSGDDRLRVVDDLAVDVAASTVLFVVDDRESVAEVSAELAQRPEDGARVVVVG
jgi:hypothetical protein